MDENCLPGVQLSRYKEMLDNCTRQSGHFTLHNARAMVEKSAIAPFVSVTESGSKGVFNCCIRYIRNKKCKFLFKIINSLFYLIIFLTFFSSHLFCWLLRHPKANCQEWGLPGIRYQTIPGWHHSRCQWHYTAASSSSTTRSRWIGCSRWVSRSGKWESIAASSWSPTRSWWGGKCRRTSSNIFWLAWCIT